MKKQLILAIGLVAIILASSCVSNTVSQSKPTMSTPIATAALLPKFITYEDTEYPVIDMQKMDFTKRSDYVGGLLVMKFHQENLEKKLTPPRYAIPLHLKDESWVVQGRKWRIRDFENHPDGGMIVHDCVIDIHKRSSYQELRMIKYRFKVYQKTKRNPKMVDCRSCLFYIPYFDSSKNRMLSEILLHINIDYPGAIESIWDDPGWDSVEEGKMYHVIVHRYNFRICRCRTGENENYQYFMLGPVNPVVIY